MEASKTINSTCWLRGSTSQRKDSNIFLKTKMIQKYFYMTQKLSSYIFRKASIQLYQVTKTSYELINSWGNSWGKCSQPFTKDERNDNKHTYLGSQPRTSAIPTNDNRNGAPTLDAWIASSRWPMCKASNFPNATIPPTEKWWLKKERKKIINYIASFKMRKIKKNHNYHYQ